MAHPGAVFLDRDGTLVVEKNYLSDPNEVELERGVVEGLQLLQADGLPLVVLTNQSGIGRGYYSLEAANAVNEHINLILRADGVAISAWYLCPHAPGDGCGCRKPGRVLADRAATDLGLCLERSFVIGDKRSDLELALAIGATGILVTTGHGRGEVAWAAAKGCVVAHGLLDAARHVVAQRSTHVRRASR